MKKRKIWLVWFSLIAMLLSTLTGCGNSGTADAKQTTTQSKKLTIYVSFPEEEVPTYVSAFEKETGIKVSYVRLSAGEVFAKLQAEKNNPQASVWYGGPSDTFIAAVKEGLLDKYSPKDLSKIPEQYKDKDGYWSPVYVGALAFACNKDWFTKNNLKYPTSWDDLLKPEFKGQISIAHPGTSGTSYTVLCTLVQMMGQDKAIEYLKKLNTNVRQYTKSGSAPPQQVALGEAAIGVAMSHDCLKPTAQGYPIELSFPQEGTGYEIGAVALIKGGPKDEVENAKKFIDWSITKEAQELYETSKSFRLPVNKDATPPKGAVKLEDIKTINYDFVFAGDNRKNLVELFTKQVSDAKNVK